jgi:enoyl-CoA hydratase
MIPLETGARQPETDAERAVADNPKIVQKAMLRDFELYKPVIAAVNGLAIAAGMELVQACDIRIASETAKFGLAEVKWAVFPRGGSTVRLPRQIPFCKAMEILLTGDFIDAAEALRIGFVNDVVPRDKVMEEAERIASKIVKNGPLAIEGVKKAVTRNMGLTIEEGLKNEWELSQPVFQSRDAKEGPKAFKEKREPEYRGE